MTRRLKSRAAAARRFAFLMKVSGMALPAERVREAIAKGERLDTEARAEREEAARAERARFDGCASVTQVAREIGVARTALFCWLEDAGWMRRVERGGWCATGQAIADAFVVERGPASIRWVQITPHGQQEIARRIGHSTPPERCE